MGAKTSLPLVSIIIVSYNGLQYLKDCLRTISHVSYPELEVIVVDNNSSDSSVEFIKNQYPNFKIVQLDKNYGFARANNMGTQHALGKYFLFLNNDTLVTPNFVLELVQVMEGDPQIGICQSLLLKPNEEVDSSGDFIDSLGVSYSSKEKINSARNILSAKGASMLMKKEVFEKLDGFDEEFFVSFEDVDLGWRTWIINYRVVVVPSSVVHHIGGQTINKMKQEIAFHGLKNQLSMKITNFEGILVPKNLFLFFMTYGWRMLQVMIDYKIKGSTEITSTKYEKIIAQKPSLKVILKAILWLVRNRKYLMQKHQKINSMRILTTKQLKELKVIKTNL